MGIVNVNSGDSATRVLALSPGTVTAPCKDGLVPCDLTMFEGLSGGAMTLAIAIALGGVLVMVLGDTRQAALLGDLAALAAALGFAVFTILLRRGKSSDMMPAVLLSGLLSIPIMALLCVHAGHLDSWPFRLRSSARASRAPSRQHRLPGGRG